MLSRDGIVRLGAGWTVRPQGGGKWIFHNHYGGPCPVDNVPGEIRSDFYFTMASNRIVGAQAVDPPLWQDTPASRGSSESEFEIRYLRTQARQYTGEGSLRWL